MGLKPRRNWTKGVDDSSPVRASIERMGSIVRSRSTSRGLPEDHNDSPQVILTNVSTCAPTHTHRSANPDPQRGLLNRVANQDRVQFSHVGTSIVIRSL